MSCLKKEVLIWRGIAFLNPIQISIAKLHISFVKCQKKGGVQMHCKISCLFTIFPWRLNFMMTYQGKGYEINIVRLTSFINA